MYSRRDLARLALGTVPGLLIRTRERAVRARLTRDHAADSLQGRKNPTGFGWRASCSRRPERDVEQLGGRFPVFEDLSSSMRQAIRQDDGQLVFSDVPPGDYYLIVSTSYAPPGVRARD